MNIDGLPYVKFSTSVQFLAATPTAAADCNTSTESPDTPSASTSVAVSSPDPVAATCYIAFSDGGGEAPSNVCDVTSNGFQFEEDNLLFYILIRS